MIIKRVRVVRFAIFQMTIFGLIGLLCGVFYAFGGLLIDTIVTLGLLAPERTETPGLSYGTFLAFGALIGMPFIGLFFGFMAGLIGGVVFNFIVPKIGIQLPNFSKE